MKQSFAKAVMHTRSVRAWLTAVTVALLAATAPVRGAINSVAFTAPAFRPSEGAPVQATQAELGLLVDADPGQYRLTVYRSTSGELVRQVFVRHTASSGTAERHGVAVPLREGDNRFYVNLHDVTTAASTADSTTPDSPVITRDTLTRVYSVTLDALSPYQRTTALDRSDIEFTINGTASSYLVEVRNLSGPVTTFTTGAGSRSYSGIPLAPGANDIFLRVRANDTYSDAATVDSNVVTIVYDDTDPVVNNLTVAFPLLPTDDAVVSLQGDTEPFALVRVDNGAGEVYYERANALGFFSVLGVDLPLTPPGPTTTTFTVTATDNAGRMSAPAVVTADRTDGDPRFNYIQMEPGDGWYMRPDEPIHIQGSVGDIQGPYQVRFYARAGTGFPLLEEILDGLDPFTAFEKDMALTPDPTQPGTDVVYSVEAEVVSTNGVSGRHFLGEVILDVADPPAVRFSDGRLDQVLFTNAPALSLQGETERYSSVWFSNWSGVTYRPGNKVYSEATNSSLGGEFRVTLDLDRLPEQRISLEVTAVATSTRTGPSSKRTVVIERDVTAPEVTALTVDGEPEGTGRSHYHRAGDLLTLRLTLSEAMAEAPEVFVTQRGSEALPAALSAVVVPGRVFEYIYVIQNSHDYDGRLDVLVSGGSDLAGNVLSPEYRTESIIVADTLPPVIDGTASVPADGSVVSSRPDPVKIVLNEHPDSVDGGSGIDIEACSLQVFGPFESDPTRTNSGTLTRYAPGTLEFRFDPGQAVEEGTYNILVTAVDKAGNTTTEAVVYRLDLTPVSQLFVDTVTPAPGGSFDYTSWPVDSSGRQFVSVSFDPAVTGELDLSGSRLFVENLCPIPHQVPGTKSTTGTNGLVFTFDRNFSADGRDDGVYTIQVEPRDTAGNLSPTMSYNVVYDTVAPFVLDGFHSLPEHDVAAEDSIFPRAGTVVRGPLRHVSATVVDGVAPAPNEFTGSGVNTSLTTGSDIELVLVERHPTTTLAVGASTSDVLTSTLKFTSVQPPVYSPCFPGVRRATVMRELVTDPVSGDPAGLAVDGSHDGEWELRVKPVDKAGNEGDTAYARFTYDTIPPGLVVNVITNDEHLTGSTLVTTGTAWDNDKTSHDQGQGVARVAVRLEAADSWGATTAPPLIDWTDVPMPPNRDLLPAETVITWRFEGRIPSYDGRGRLLVKAFDLAGNETLVVRELNIHSDLLDAPSLVAPANGAALPGAVVDFSWTRVEGASAYRVVLRDPAGNELVKTVDFPNDHVSFNLASRPEGRWTWTVEAVDTQGTPGRPAMARSFLLDATRPVVVNLSPFDATVPSAQSGSILNGQIRIGITFSEDMDVTTSPEVVFQPADPGIPATTVVQISYLGREWRGVVDIPPGPDQPDYNGMGTVTVRNALDLAGNAAEEYVHSFEVDLGPWFDVKAFANPVAKTDVIFFVRCHQRRGGPLEALAGIPTMEIQQEGAPKAVVRLRVFQPYVYRGTYTIDRNHPGNARILITGTDRDGNTAKRLMNFSVAEILAADRFVHTFGNFLQVRLEPGSVRESTCVALLPADTAGIGLDDPAGGELKILKRFENLAQGPIALARSGLASCDLSRLSDGAPPAGKVGLFIYRDGRWVYQKSVRQGDRLVSTIDGLGHYALAADDTPPRIEIDGASSGMLRLDRSLPFIEGRLSDRGAGVAYETVIAAIDGRPVGVDIDEGSGRLSLEPARPLSPGEHELRILARDRMGNESRWSMSMLAPEALGLSSFVAAPNPSSGPVTFQWRVNQATDGGRLSIYDVSGHRVRSFTLPAGGPGTDRFHWDGTDSRGRPVANGVYIVRLKLESGGSKTRMDCKVAMLR